MPCNLSPLLYSSLFLYLQVVFIWGLSVGGQGSISGPQFGEVESSVSVSAGDTTRLPCIVHQLNDRSVTWLRRRDLHILTVGHHTYSADDRFKVVHREGSDEWTLVIRYTQPRDAGIYDCQINTDPKISHPVTLKILDTSKEVGQTKTKVFVANNTASTSDGDLKVEILGPRELYIEEGSSLSLTCLVTSAHGPSTVVYWYHNTNLIDYNSPRGGINLKIDREKGKTTTHLLVSSVGPGDSGMYSCVPTGSHPATVRVHVNQGENEAAIQQGGLGETNSASTITPFIPFLPFLLLILTIANFSFKLSTNLMKSLTIPIGCYSSEENISSSSSSSYISTSSFSSSSSSSSSYSLTSPFSSSSSSFPMCTLTLKSEATPILKSSSSTRQLSIVKGRRLQWSNQQSPNRAKKRKCHLALRDLLATRESSRNPRVLSHAPEILLL